MPCPTARNTLPEIHAGSSAPTAIDLDPTEEQECPSLERMMAYFAFIGFPMTVATCGFEGWEIDRRTVPGTNPYFFSTSAKAWAWWKAEAPNLCYMGKVLPLLLGHFRQAREHERQQMREWMRSSMGCDWKPVWHETFVRLRKDRGANFSSVLPEGWSKQVSVWEWRGVRSHETFVRYVSRMFDQIEIDEVREAVDGACPAALSLGGRKRI